MFIYRYELRKGDQIVSTGRLNLAQPLETGDSIELAGGRGIVRAIDPVLNTDEAHLIVQLVTD